MSIVYFAWVDPGTAFSAGTHAVFDEQVVSFTIDHEEGSFAKLTLVIRNPKVGPLSAGRKIWAWLSVENGSEVTPLFYGRIVAIPQNILGETITYDLLARPSDWPEQRVALADAMRVLPFYDEVFVSEEQRDNPDAVLEGYSKRWHIDRVTHIVTASDVLAGEDGVIEFGTADVPYDSLNISVSRAPLTAVTVKGSIPWVQGAAGVLDMGTKIIPTYTTDSLVNNWPKTGDALAGGYYVVSATAINETPAAQNVSWNFSYSNRAEKHEDGDVMSISESYSGPGGRVPLGGAIRQYGEIVIGDPETGTPASSSINQTFLVLLRGQIRTTLVLGIGASRDRKDNVQLTLESDLQPVLRDPDDTSDKELIDIGGVDVSKTCTSDASPIENAGRSEFVTTDRGIQSIEYMLARARARLLMGARVVDVSFNCRFDAAVAVELSCRKNGFIADSRIPGGEALGKIVSYSLSGDGSSGVFIASIKMSCAVGNGNTLETSAGSSEYVDNSYMDPSYQTHIGQVIALSSGDVGYSPPVLASGGGGVFMAALSKSDLVVREEIISSAPEQKTAFDSNITPFGGDGASLYVAFADYYEAAARESYERMAEVEMWYELELKNLEGAGIEAHWEVPTAALVIPKQIDLTAA